MYEQNILQKIKQLDPNKNILNEEYFLNLLHLIYLNTTVLQNNNNEINILIKILLQDLFNNNEIILKGEYNTKNILPIFLSNRIAYDK